MRILFFIENLGPGGKERRLSELLKKLHGHPDFTFEIVLTKKLVHYQEIIEKRIKIHYLERKYLKKDPSLFFKFYKICRNFRPDIIHVWGNMPAIYAIPAKLFLGIKLVNNQITDATEKTRRRILAAKMVFLFSDKIIANSKAGLESYFISGKKTSVIYGGFDYSRIDHLLPCEEIRSRFSITTGKLVAMVSSFYTYKDYPTYIAAANSILESFRDVTFLCIGYGNDRPYRELVHEKNRDLIIFPGVQDNIESIMNCCDIGVLATKTEGISNAVMEFMALGKPVVATDGGGTKELVADNTTGFLVPFKDQEKLAEKISFLLKNDETAREMGEAGRKRIRTEFSPEKMVSNFIGVYRELSQENK